MQHPASPAVARPSCQTLAPSRCGKSSSAHALSRSETLRAGQAMSRWCGNAVSRVTKWQRTGHEPMRPSLLQTPLILEAKDTALRRRGRAIHGCRASSNHASASEAVVPGSCAISRDEESSAGCHTAGEDGPLWKNEQCVGIQNAGTIAVRPESPSACKRRNVQRVRQGSRPVSAVHPRSWGLTLPSRGRATSGFASCRPPLMSNVRRPETFCGRVYESVR